MKTDPFHHIKHHENSLKLPHLYQCIAKELKNEAYDDQPIDHAYVAKYEEQIPGIITSYSGDHSFLNSDSEENRKVIMEAVDSGMALKAGIAVAVATLLYKIMRVFFNNKEFNDDNGGGRGSPTYKRSANEEATKAVEELKDSKQKAKEAIKVNGNNPINRDEDSPANKASRQLADVLDIRDPSNTGEITDASSYITKTELILVQPRNLASMFALKDYTAYDNLLKDVKFIMDTLAEDRSAISTILTLCTAYASLQPGENADKHWNTIHARFMRLINPITGELKDISAIKEAVDNRIKPILDAQRSWTDVSSSEDASKYFDIEQLSKSFAMELPNTNDQLWRRSERMGEFNAKFKSQFMVGFDWTEADSYQTYITATEALNEAKRREDVGSDDPEMLRVYKERATSLLIMTDILFAKLSKAIITFRRSADTIDEFIRTETKEFVKINDKYKDLITAYNKDGGI